MGFSGIPSHTHVFLLHFISSGFLWLWHWFPTGTYPCFQSSVDWNTREDNLCFPAARKYSHKDRHWILTVLCSLRLLRGKGSVPSMNEQQFCFSLSLKSGHNRDFLLFLNIAIILGFCFVSNLWPKQLILASWALAGTQGSSSWTTGLYFSKSTSKCTVHNGLDIFFPVLPVQD